MRNHLPLMLSGIALAVPLAAGPMYTVIDLGSLGGGSAAFALNSSGLAAGRSLTPQHDVRGVQLGAGAPPADLWAGQANGINDAGTVAGTAYHNGQRQAVIWSGGAVTQLGTLGGAGSEALAVNSAGTVVGLAATPSGQGRAFRWSQGNMSDLGTLPGGVWSAAYAVNDAGAAAGTAMTSGGFFRAVMWTPEMMLLELGTLGGLNSYAHGINSSGQVVGHSTAADGWMRAFLYSGGAMRELGTLGGGNSYAYGINGAGWVVGYSWLASGSGPRAFLWSGGEMADLNTRLPAGSGWLLTEAYAINNFGQIAGAGLLGGELRAFRLDPVSLPHSGNPEPATLVLIGGGLAALGLLRRGPAGR